MFREWFETNMVEYFQKCSVDEQANIIDGNGSPAASDDMSPASSAASSFEVDVEEKNENLVSKV